MPFHCLLEITLKQTLQSLAVSGLVARHFMHSVMDGVKVILLGGTVRGNSRSVVGPLTESNLKVFYCDKLFLGVDSFSVESGLSTPSVEEASTNQVMISQAREVIAVFDSSKVNKRSLAFIAGADKINTLISDDKLSIQVKSQLVALGVKVETVTA